METIKNYLPQTFFVAAILCFFGWIYWITLYTPNVFIGDVWRYTYGDSDNPFENVRSYDAEVLDVKDGYAKMLDLRDSTIEVNKLRYFKSDRYKLIKRGGGN